MPGPRISILAKRRTRRVCEPAGGVYGAGGFDHPHLLRRRVDYLGFLISPWLGTVIFGATILHNIPEGFTMASIMAAAKRSRSAGMMAAAFWAISRVLGVLGMALAHRWANYGLAISAGVTLYVAASDLIPEVNKTQSPKYALTVALGVAMVLVMRYLFFAFLSGPPAQYSLMYSETVLDHFHHPRNVGEIADASVVVEASNPVCGDVMKLWAVVRDGRIQWVKFKAAGCVPSVACGSWLTEAILSKSSEESSAVTPKDVVAALGGLPGASHHAASLAVDVLKRLLEWVCDS